MPIKTEHICDTCGEAIEWSFRTIDETVLKEPSFVYDIFMPPEPQKIFCSMYCLAKDVQYLAEHYEDFLEDRRRRAGQ